VNKLSSGAVEVVLALMFAVPQLEWVGFLAYVALRFRVLAFTSTIAH
jgi:hypothetical protein